MLKSQEFEPNELYNLAEKLWPLNRSLTGEGVRETLSIIKNEISALNIYEVPTGTKAFDWTVPKEWVVREAYIITPTGAKICDFSESNLHLVGYSIPCKRKIKLAELQKHLYSIPEQPNAIPYITSYYKPEWGFCLTHDTRQSLPEGEYEVVIDSEHIDGSLTYGELIIEGESKKEVFFSTYICHPSMANNELSGPVVTTFLARKLLASKNLKYTYRIIFIPETIGSIVYLSKNIEYLKEHIIAGFNVSCVGDDRSYSYLPSRNGNTLSDVTAKHVLKFIDPDYVTYTWRERGSDERQYCAPGVDLPVSSIMRTKYGAYAEYHTSLDDLINVVTPTGLAGGLNALWQAVQVLENNVYPKVTVLCEPQLGDRGLYPTTSSKKTAEQVQLLLDLITWSDGSKSLLEIADLCDVSFWDVHPILNDLLNHGLIEVT